MSVDDNQSNAQQANRRPRQSQVDSVDQHDAQQQQQHLDRPTKRRQQMRLNAQEAGHDEQQQQHQEEGREQNTERQSREKSTNSPSKSPEKAISASTSATQSTAELKDRSSSYRHFSIGSLLIDDHEEDQVESLNVSPVPSPTNTSFANSSDAQRRHGQAQGNVTTRSSGRRRGRTYTVSLESVPIQCTTDGIATCDPPLVVKLDITQDSSTSSTSSRLDGGFNWDDDLPYLTACVTLLEPTTSASLSSSSISSVVYDGQDGQQWVESRQLAGHLRSTPRIFRDRDGASGIYFCFPGLQIIRPGAYTLRVAIHGHWEDDKGATVEQSQSQAQTHKVGGLQYDAATRVVQVVTETSTLAVPESSPLAVGRVQINSETAELLDLLNRQGARLS